VTVFLVRTVVLSSIGFVFLRSERLEVGDSSRMMGNPEVVFRFSAASDYVAPKSASRKSHGSPPSAFIGTDGEAFRLAKINRQGAIVLKLWC
jgi:hypothetical protein